MIVNDYMTPDPLKVSMGESVERIAELIRQHNVRQVPVVDRSNRLVGIVTDRDIRSSARRLGADNVQVTAEDIMTHHPVTIEPFADLRDAAQILYEHPFGALPVVSGDRILGIISTHDLLRRFMELCDESAHTTNHRYESSYPF